MPVHDDLQHCCQEPSIALRFVFGAGRHRVRDVAEDPVEADQRREVRGLEHVDDVNELGAVDGVGDGEDAAREEAELQERRDRLVLGQLRRAREEPGVLLLLEPGHHALHVLLLASLLVHHLVEEARQTLLLLLLSRRVQLLSAKRRLFLAP